jgi:ubiquinol-cytochrome c reductase cytochrome c1 subunit
VAFRDLKEIGYNDAEVKAIAAGFKVPSTTRHRRAEDARRRADRSLPARGLWWSGTPPDLSLITKARHGGAAYVHSLLTGYADQPAELLKKYPEARRPTASSTTPTSPT